MSARLPIALLASLLVSGAFTPAALANTDTVLNNQDSGPGSLRDTIANAAAGDTVLLPSSVGSITLSSEIALSRNVSIQGSGTPDPTLTGNGSTRIFHIMSPTSGPAPVVTLASLVITDGAAHLGGAIDQEAGELTLTGVTVSASTATPSGGTGGSGGGIFQQAGSLTIRDSRITGNAAGAGADPNAGGGTGGGIYHTAGSLTIENTSVSSNVASALAGAKGGTGGAIFDQSGPVALTATHVDSNTAFAGAGGAVGGGIFHGDGPLTIAGGSISHDAADGGTDPGGAGSDAGDQSAASGSAISGVGGGLYDRMGGLTVTGTTLSGNAAYPSSQDNGMGGAIYHERDSLTVSGVTFTDNQAGPPGDTGGGGVAGALFDHGGPVRVSTSTFARNTAFGGANPSVPGNSGPAGTGSLAGAMYVKHGSLALDRSTLSGNTAEAGTGKDGFGGAIYNQGAALTLTNDTLDSNTAGVGVRRGLGGGIYTQRAENATTTLNNVTLSANAATGAGGQGSELFDDAAAAPAGITAVHNTIIGPSAQAVPNCFGPITSHGHNLDSGTSCGLGGAGDLVARDPLLGPLALNPPGTTATRALVPASPAVDAGENAGCPAVDQRGQTRPADGSGHGVAICDMGAYEYAPDGATGTETAGPVAQGLLGALALGPTGGGPTAFSISVTPLADGDADVTVTAPGPGALVVRVVLVTGRARLLLLEPPASRLHASVARGPAPASGARAATRRAGASVARARRGARRRRASAFRLTVAGSRTVRLRIHPVGRAGRLVRRGHPVAARLAATFAPVRGPKAGERTRFTLAKRVRSSR